MNRGFGWVGMRGACMIVQTPFIQDNDVQMKLDFLQIKYYSIVMGGGEEGEGVW